MSRRLSASIACTLSALVLTGCGEEAGDTPTQTQGSSEETTSSESSEPTEPEPTEPEPTEFDPATATLSDSPFCDELDTDAAASALGSGRLKLVAERVVGKKYKSPLGGDPIVSTSNSCVYADGGNTASFIVAVGPGASARDVKDGLRIAAENVGAEGQSDKCAVKKETTYGTPGGVVLCTDVAYSQKGRAEVYVASLVGGSRFFCSGAHAKGSTPEQLEQPVRDLCAEVLEQRAAG